MKPTIWIFPVEPLDTRYTGQWHTHIPQQLQDNLNDKFNICQIDGYRQSTEVTQGAFLNFVDTNYWKSSQLCTFLLKQFEGKTTPDDHFLFTDAWNTSILQLKYINDLMGFNWQFHGLWHAGNYDEHDFLGAIKDAWVKHTERALYTAFTHNYFATEFHVKMFFDKVINSGYPSENPWYDEDWDEVYDDGSIVRTGWPMEYLTDTLAPFKNKEKRDLIVFPHRIAPEKQVEIFRAIAKQMPQYDFVVCQDEKLTKDEYHTLLSEAKIVFSANLQETLGISCYEGVMLDAIPMVPDRLSYKEMYKFHFKYPSEWTEDFKAYEDHSFELCNKIIDYIENYDSMKTYIQQQADYLTKAFFNAEKLYDKFN